MLSPKQRFKVAFLALCADQGLTLPETHDLVKLACEELEKKADTATSTVLKTLKKLPGDIFRMARGGALWSAGLGIPAGAALGYGAAKLTSGINDQTPEEVKSRELIEEYDRRAQAARLSVLLRARQQSKTRRRGRALI